MNAPQHEPLPVTVLTGFLGAGKTTLLSRVLTETHGRRYLVIINEFGEIGIDHDLVASSDEAIVEMNNGCICCTVRGDLIDILTHALEKEPSFDGVLIETTGLADPAPVIQTFFVDPFLSERLRLDAVITVVDALHLPRQLLESHEAEEQIALADVVILNKIDLVSEQEARAVSKRLLDINPLVTLRRTVRCNVDLGLLLDRNAFDIARVLAEEPDFLTSDHAHEHDGAVTSLSLTASRPIDHDRLVAWLTSLLQERGADILRCKGIFDVAGCDERFAVQGVHMLLDGDFQRRWMPEEARRSRLVFIGRNLDKSSLVQGLEGCRA